MLVALEHYWHTYGVSTRWSQACPLYQRLTKCPGQRAEGQDPRIVLIASWVCSTSKSSGDEMGTKKRKEKSSARVSVKLGDNGGRGELRLRQVSAVSRKRI